MIKQKHIYKVGQRFILKDRSWIQTPELENRVKSMVGTIIEAEDHYRLDGTPMYYIRWTRHDNDHHTWENQWSEGSIVARAEFIDQISFTLDEELFKL